MRTLRALIALAMLLAARGAFAQCTPGPHSGTITADQTWCAADSPHAFSGAVTIAAGATVTVEAGSVLNPGDFTIRGRLVVQGTEASPVTFDNGRWTGLDFEGGTGSLSWARVLNAGFNSAGITARNVPAPGLVLAHVTLGPGGGSLSITDSVVTVTASTLDRVWDFCPVSVAGSSTLLSFTGNTFSGNRANEVCVAAGAMTDADFALGPQAGLDAWHLGGDYTIPVGRTVTLAAGTRVYQDGSLVVRGRLVSQGTPSQPVTITNGYRWTGLDFEGGTGTLAYTAVTNAGFNTPGITARNVPAPGLVLDHATLGPGNGRLLVDGSFATLLSSALNGVNGDVYPVEVVGSASVLAMTNVAFTGNRVNQVLLGPGAMTGADFKLTPQPGLEAYRLTGGYSVPAGRTVTVDAGVTLVPEPSVVVQGRLVTKGTAASPVTFTNGRWTGIVVDGGTATLAGALVVNGGFNSPSILVQNLGALLLERSRVTGGAPVRGEAGSLVVRNSVVSDSSGAFELAVGSTLTAVHATLARNRTAVSVQGGSTATLTNTIVAASDAGVVTDASSTATLTNTLWDGVATWSSGNVTRRGEISGAAAFAADGYHLSASSAALAQGVLTAVVDDVDGEARPRPAGLLPDLGADEADGGVLLPGRTATPIAVGETKGGTAPAGTFSDWVVNLAPGATPNLKVRVESASGTGGFRLLVRNRQLPLATIFDVEGDPADATAREVLVAAPIPGAWYVGVLSTATDVPFTITVGGAERGVSTISPSSGGNSGTVTVGIDGAGFEDGVRVELRSAGVPLLSTSPVGRTATHLTARLALAGLSPQDCDACVAWPDGISFCLPGSFRIVGGGAGGVVTHLAIPDVLRGGRGTTGAVSWVNTGNVDADAPLLVVSSDQNAPMRRDGRQPWTRGEVRFLGIDTASPGSAGVLAPGARGRATFEIFSEGPAHALLTFALHQLSDAAMARPIDWGTLEASMKPEGIDSQTWARIWPLVRRAIGATWGDYVRSLRSNSSYLSGLGRWIADPGALLGVTVDRALETGPQRSLASGLDAACPAPGLPLTFGRSFANGPLGRATVGELGVGWTHTYDKLLATLSNGDREVRSNDGTARPFRLLPDGSFLGSSGDPGRLVVSGGTARLVERSGIVLSFRADGRLASISDGDGNRIDASWDASGRLASVTHTNGDRLLFDHDAAGRLVRLTDHAAEVTTYSYDASGRRLVQVTRPGGLVTRYAYKGTSPDADALVSIAFSDGSHVFYDYDSSGRLVGHRRDAGPGTTFARDVLGRVVVSHGAAGTGMLGTLAPEDGAVVLALDEEGRLGEAVDPLGHAVCLGWGDDGLLADITDPLGNVSALEHGPLGEVAALLEPEGAETRESYRYPSAGGRFVRSLTDPRASRSAFATDPAGRVTSITYPGGGAETLARDARGLVTAYTNRRGQTIHYERNSRGQVTRKELPGGGTVTYGYDAAGRLATVTEVSGTTRLSWDARGFLTEVAYPSGKWFRYEVDGSGRTTRRTSDDGYVLSVSYDAAGRPVRVTRNGGALVASYDWDALGRLSREEHENGTATTYSWDAASRLTGVTHLGPSGSTLATFAYAYDAAGRITSATGPDGIATYAWDSLGRLTSERAPSGVLTTYTYDASGNRVRVETGGVVVPYTVNAENQVVSAGATSYAWDADGNVTSRTTPSGTTTFTWDAERRLTQVSGAAGTAAYTWNALGGLEAQTVGGVTSRFVNDPVVAAGAAATVLDGAGALASRYDHGASLASAVDALGAVSSYHFDGRGNTAAVTDASGAARATYAYDAHGNVTAATGSGTNPFTTLGSEAFSGLLGNLFTGRSSSATPYDPAAGRYAAPTLDGYSAGANLYTPWKELTLQQPKGPPKSLAGYAADGVDWYFWGKGKLGAIHVEAESPEMDLGGAVEPAWNSLKGIAQAYDASEKGDTLSAVEAVGNSALADLELLGVAFPPLRPVAALTKGIATAGKGVCDLYVWNLAPNRDPYWFQPVPRNKWYYLNENLSRVAVTPEDRKLLERTNGKDQVFPGDPNEKDATPGAGPRHRVRAGSRLYYNVFFENVPTASAPAQEVFVTDTLDPSLDVSSLELVDAGWGSTSLAAPEGARSWEALATVRDYRPSDLRLWWVDLAARETAPGRLAWTFRTLDPATGGLPEDALAGFLPPDDPTGRGRGWVLFSAKTKTGLAPGTRIANRAVIVFDTEAPITTNEVFHTIGLPGDVNDDGVVNPADVFYLVNRFYAGGPEPLGVADANFDGKVDALDLFYLINHLYAGGPAPQ